MPEEMPDDSNRRLTLWISPLGSQEFPAFLLPICRVYMLHEPLINGDAEMATRKKTGPLPKLPEPEEIPFNDDGSGDMDPDAQDAARQVALMTWHLKEDEEVDEPPDFRMFDWSWFGLGVKGVDGSTLNPSRWDPKRHNPEALAAFLTDYAQSGTICHAAMRAGLSYDIIQNDRARFPEFEDLCEIAKSYYMDLVIGTMHKMGVKGRLEPVIGGRNKDMVVTWIRKYDMKAVDMLAKALDPVRFGNKTAVAIEDGNKSGVLEIPAQATIEGTAQVIEDVEEVAETTYVEGD